MNTHHSILTIFVVCLCSFTSSKYLYKQLKAKQQLIQSGSIKQEIICTYGSFRNETVIQLGNCQDILFSIQLGIGTPPQYFQFQFDTGSNILWIPTTQTLSQGFNLGASSTKKITQETYTLSYADGSSVTGNAGSDFVSILQTSINDRNLILFVEQQQDMEFPGTITGLVGMGYSEIPNFIDVAYNAGQIETNTFSLNLSHFGKEPSLLFYNKIPQQIINNSLDSYLISSNFWQLQVVGVFFGSQDLTYFSSQKAVIDSGTTFFYLNQALFQQIYQQNFAQSCRIIKNNIINVNIVCLCSLQKKLPPIKILFEGVGIQIYPSDYFEPINDTYCLANFGTLPDQSDQLLLGDTIFYNYIISFDQQQQKVGFCANFADAKRKPFEVKGIGKAQWFIIGEWIMLSFGIVILCVFVFMLYHLRRIKNQSIRQKIMINKNYQMKNYPINQNNRSY